MSRKYIKCKQTLSVLEINVSLRNVNLAPVSPFPQAPFYLCQHALSQLSDTQTALILRTFSPKWGANRQTHFLSKQTIPLSYLISAGSRSSLQIPCRLLQELTTELAPVLTSFCRRTLPRANSLRFGRKPGSHQYSRKDLDASQRITGLCHWLALPVSCLSTYCAPTSVGTWIDKEYWRPSTMDSEDVTHVNLSYWSWPMTCYSE